MSIGERLKQARLAAGLSQRQLADLATPLTAMAVSNYETGRSTPSSDRLLRLAKALGVRFEFFFRVASVDLGPPHYREHGRLGSKTRRAIVGQVAEALERHLAAEMVFGVHAPPRRTLGVRVAATAEDAEAAAGALRRAWSLGDDPIGHLCAALEDHGVTVVLLSSAPDGFEGLSCWANGTIPVVAARTDRQGEQQRLTLALELGHLALDLSTAQDPDGIAHRFAGAFLAPRRAVLREFGAKRTHLGVGELHGAKHKWGLSMHAWLHRLRDADVISRSTLRRAVVTFGRNEWGVKEPGEAVPREGPRRLERLVERALVEDLISPLRAAELLGRPLSEAPAGLAVGAEVA